MGMVARRGAWLAMLALLACGCGDDDVARSIEPGHGPLSGYYPLVVAEPGVKAADVVAVNLGGIKAYDLVALDEHHLQFTVQGQPQPGPADLELVTASGSHLVAAAFAYEPPLDARFERVVAVGASLTQGVQNGVPTHHGGLVSPAAQLARQLGGYFPLPLLIHEFLPPMSAADIGPPPECEPPDVVAHVTASAIEVLPKIQYGYQSARIDADIAIRNLAVGGSKIHHVLAGPPAEDFGANFISHLVLDPYGTGPVTTSQLSMAEALEPTVVISTDLFGNDVAASILAAGPIDPAKITPVDEFQADLEALLARLAATGAEVFVANMPQPSLLPLTQTKRTQMIAEAVAGGQDETSATADADQAIADTDAAAVAYNMVLTTVADSYPSVHIVDLAGRVGEIAQSGLDAGGQHLTSQKFGGLLSFDGVHFTDTGYSLLANLFIDSINDALGTAAPPVDYDRTVVGDQGSPANIAVSGLDVSLCDR